MAKQAGHARAVFGLIGIVAFYGANVSAQRTALDRPVQGEFLVSDLRAEWPCFVGTALEQIARRTGVLIGFESERCAEPQHESRGRYRPNATGDVWDLSGATAREAIHKVLGAAPSYRAEDCDGTYVVRPNGAWGDPGNLLNRRVQPFSTRGAPMGDVLRAAMKSTSPPIDQDARPPYLWHPSKGPAPIDRPVSMAFSGGTLLDVLNMLSKQQNVNWQVGYVHRSARIWVSDIQLFPTGGLVVVQTSELR